MRMGQAEELPTQRPGYRNDQTAAPRKQNMEDVNTESKARASSTCSSWLYMLGNPNISFAKRKLNHNLGVQSSDKPRTSLKNSEIHEFECSLPQPSGYPGIQY